MTFDVDAANKKKTTTSDGNLKQHLLQVANHFSD